MKAFSWWLSQYRSTKVSIPSNFNLIALGIFMQMHYAQISQSKAQISQISVTMTSTHQITTSLFAGTFWHRTPLWEHSDLPVRRQHLICVSITVKSDRQLWENKAYFVAMSRSILYTQANYWVAEYDPQGHKTV